MVTNLQMDRFKHMRFYLFIFGEHIQRATSDGSSMPHAKVQFHRTVM